MAPGRRGDGSRSPWPGRCRASRVAVRRASNERAGPRGGCTARRPPRCAAHAIVARLPVPGRPHVLARIRPPTHRTPRGPTGDRPVSRVRRWTQHEPPQPGSTGDRRGRGRPSPRSEWGETSHGRRGRRACGRTLRARSRVARRPIGASTRAEAPEPQNRHGSRGPRLRSRNLEPGRA